MQVLVIFTSMVVVAFVTLLQNPVLGSPTWLPLLLGCWTVAYVVTMALQAELPLPDIQRCETALRAEPRGSGFATLHHMQHARHALSPSLSLARFMPFFTAATIPEGVVGCGCVVAPV